MPSTPPRLPPPPVVPSGTIATKAAADARKAQGLPVFDLTAGEPDFPAVAPALAGLHEAADLGLTRYGAAAGMIELRAAIAEDAEKSAGLASGTIPPARVFVSAGAKAAFWHLLTCLLDRKETPEVIIPVPCWTSYPEQVKLAGGAPVTIDTARTGWKPTPEALAMAITDKTRAVILCNPHNPTGAVIDRARLDELLALCEEKGLWAIVDEIYGGLEHDFPAGRALKRGGAGVIVVDGAAKRHALTGLRVGWAIAPEPLVDAMSALQTQTLTCPPLPSQRAALRALRETEPAELARRAAAFKARRDLLRKALSGIPGVESVAGEGAFYLFLDARGALARLGMTSRELSTKLLTEDGVALVPGEAFLAPGTLRLSYATDEATLSEAALRLARRLRS